MSIYKRIYYLDCRDGIEFFCSSMTVDASVVPSRQRPVEASQVLCVYRRRVLVKTVLPPSALPSSSLRSSMAQWLFDCSAIDPSSCLSFENLTPGVQEGDGGRRRGKEERKEGRDGSGFPEVDGQMNRWIVRQMARYIHG